MLKRLLLAPEPANTNPGGGGGTGEATITAADRDAAIERARKEEKDKLYPKIQELENSLGVAETALKAEKEKSIKLTTDCQALRDKLQSLEKAKTANGEVDIAKLLEEITERVSRQSKEATENQLSELTKRLDETEKRNKTLETQQLRTRLIREAGGEEVLIPELVTGSDEEAIKASIEASKKSFERISTKARGTATLNGNGNNGNPPPTPPPLNTNGAPAGSGSNLNSDQVRSLSNKDYAAKREELKRQTAGRYGGAP